MAEDPFDLGDDEESDQPEPKQNNQLMAAQRKLTKAEKELEELRTFKAEREKADRQQAVTTTFKEAGLEPDWAEFYRGEDVTPEAVKQWAVTKKLLQPTESQEEAPAQSTGYTPTVIEGQPLGAKFYTFEEYEEIRKSDPTKADELRRAGRVQKVVPEWTTLEA